MLQYVGENHGLAQPRNQKDYTIRMREYFDYYLKGAPAPDWLKEGIPRLKWTSTSSRGRRRPRRSRPDALHRRDSAPPHRVCSRRHRDAGTRHRGRAGA
jgi:hypothetical protein